VHLCANPVGAACVYVFGYFMTAIGFYCRHPYLFFASPF
jgi:hypothetical protein